MSLDLQSGQSYWLLKNARLPDFPALDHDERADVVVVGAGVTGALAAALLAESGLDVIVVDRRALGTGSTGASTALISYEPDLSLAQLAARRGFDVAIRSYGLARNANKELARLIGRLNIGCSFEPASSMHVAGTAWQTSRLREEHRLRNKNGFPCEFLTADELAQDYGLVARSALVCADAGQLDPVRLTVGLLDYSRRRGSRVYRAQVTGVERTVRGQTVITQQGARVQADRVVHATGYETQLRLRQKSVHLTSTYVMATDVVSLAPDWLRTTILWDMDDPYHYARSVDGRILVGGGDEPFVDEVARDALMPEKAKALLAYLRHVLPGITAGIFATWCGTFARTDDSLPYIGEHPDAPGALYTLGYGGNGITFGMLGALLLRDEIRGCHSEDLDVFSFERD